MDILFLFIIGGLLVGFGGYIATRRAASPSEKDGSSQPTA